MFKKFINKMLYLIIVCLLVCNLYGCSEKKSTRIKKQPTMITKTTEKISSTPNPLESFSNGKFPIIEFCVNSNISDVISKWGNPLKKGTYQGSDFYGYEKCTFFVLKEYKPGSKSENIIEIAINKKNTEICKGVKIGMLPDEVKKVFGVPVFEESFTENENAWLFGYKVNEKLGLIFESKAENEPIYNVSLSDLNNCYTNLFQ